MITIASEVVTVVSIVVVVTLTVRFPAITVFPVAAATVNLFVLIAMSEDAPPVIVPPKVVFPVRVDVQDTVRFPAIVGLFSIFAPVTASFAIFPVVTLWSAT